jgi:hypothetical protein
MYSHRHPRRVPFPPQPGQFAIWPFLMIGAQPTTAVYGMDIRLSFEEVRLRYYMFIYL